MDASPADLRHALAVEPVRAKAGLYRGHLDGAWNFRLPSGGVLCSVALSAMRDALGRTELVPASATATFCSAVPEGPLEIEVVVLRAGKTAAQLRAQVRSLADGASGESAKEVGFEVGATFVVPRELAEAETTSWLPYPDELPAFESCPTLAPSLDGVVPPAFYRNLIVRRAKGDVWWSKTWAPAEPRVARYYEYRVPPLVSGALDPLALPPIADTMATAVHQGVGSKQPPMIFPSLDLTVHFVAPAGLSAEPILVDARGTAIFGGTASASANLWQGRRLVMVATQTMTLRTLKASR
jgi:acyl-CoA thioesterase